MPIEYEIDPGRRLVTAKGRGVLTHEEVWRYQTEVWSRLNVAGFDELMDMSGVEHIELPSIDEVPKLARLSASMDPAGRRSRFAIVAKDDLAFALGRMYETYRGLDSRSTKEVGVFRSLSGALAFLQNGNRKGD
jgi:hypothetical protein